MTDHVLAPSRDQLHARADACRQRAIRIGTSLRPELLELAELWERLAQHCERLARLGVLSPLDTMSGDGPRH